MNSKWIPSTSVSANIHYVGRIKLGEPEQLSADTWTRDLTIIGLDGSEFQITLFASEDDNYAVPEGYSPEDALRLPAELGQ